MNPKSVYAANGLAIALAETGNLNESRELFSLVRESAPEMQSAQLNLAHVLVDIGQYKAAIAIYESLNRKHTKSVGEGDVQFLLFAARAYYIMARATKSADEMQKSMGLLEYCIKSMPEEYAMVFNLALAQQQYAQLVCDKGEENRSLEELKEAEKIIDTSEATFNQLKEKKDVPPQKLGYDINLAEQRAKHCTYIRNTVIRQMTQQRANEELKREKMEELVRMREEETKRRQTEIEEAERRRIEMEQQVREGRTELIEKLLEERKEAAIKKVTIDEEKKTKGTATGSKRRTAVKRKTEDDEPADAESEAESVTEPSPSSPKKSKARTKRKKLVRKKTDEPEDEEQGDDQPAEPEEPVVKSPTKKKSSSSKQYLSEEFVQDSDEDEDNNQMVDTVASPKPAETDAE